MWVYIYIYIYIYMYVHTGTHVPCDKKSASARTTSLFLERKFIPPLKRWETYSLKTNVLCARRLQDNRIDMCLPSNRRKRTNCFAGMYVFKPEQFFTSHKNQRAKIFTCCRSSSKNSCMLAEAAGEHPGAWTSHSMPSMHTRFRGCVPCSRGSQRVYIYAASVTHVFCDPREGKKKTWCTDDWSTC
jgi:hypothetical protein